MRQWGVCIHWGGKQCVIMFFLFQGPDSRPDVSWDDGHVSVSNHYCSSPSRLKPIQSYYSGEQGSLVGAIKALVNSPLSRCLCRCQHMSKSTHTFTCFQGPKWVWILLFVWYQDKSNWVIPYWMASVFCWWIVSLSVGLREQLFCQQWGVKSLRCYFS